MTTASEHPQTGRRSGRHRLLKDNVTVIADAVLPVYLNPAGKPDESDAVVRADQFMPGRESAAGPAPSTDWRSSCRAAVKRTSPKSISPAPVS